MIDVTPSEEFMKNDYAWWCGALRPLSQCLQLDGTEWSVDFATDEPIPFLLGNMDCYSNSILYHLMPKLQVKNGTWLHGMAQEQADAVR
jgi:hypothetical protein